MTANELLEHKIDQGVKLMQENAKRFGITIRNILLDINNIKQGKNLYITNNILLKKIEILDEKHKKNDIENARMKTQLDKALSIVQDMQNKIQQLEELNARTKLESEIKTSEQKKE